MKTGAIKETVNGIKFDSRLEAEAYRILVSLYGAARVVCQYSISLSYVSPSEPIPPLTHRIDFAVTNLDGSIKHLIEVKGQLAGQWHGRQEYAMILNLMRASKPGLFSKYQVWVGDKELSFFPGKKLPFVKRFPFDGLSQARLYLP